VDPAECIAGTRARARFNWGVAENEVIVGHLANLSAEKGTIDLLQAAAEIQDGSLRFRVVLAGSAMPSFTKFRTTFGSAAWVTELGPLSDSAKRDFFAGIDAFALPSRSDSFGLVFLEAWANHLPVIGYRAGGVVDVIRHKRDGLLVPPGDLAELKEALRLMVSDSDQRLTWGKAGAERLPSEFSWPDKLGIAERALTSWT
jgi:glycosyltransferase involved in cell wall biosynthesis